MAEEFNIFKNLDDLRKTNFLDQLKKLGPVKSIDLNGSQNSDNDDEFDFDNLVNNNVKKSPGKRQSKKESSVTPKKKSKSNAKSRRSSASTDGSISPTLPLLANLSKKIDDIPLSRRTRSSFGNIKASVTPATEVQEPNQISIQPSSSKSKGRGRGRGKGRGRGRGRNQNISQNQEDCTIDLSDNSLNATVSNEMPEIVMGNQIVGTLTLTDQSLQRGNCRRRVMRARRQYVAELAARSTQVDFIDLVSSPLPRVEGMIVLDSDTEEPTRLTRAQKKANEQFSINENKTIKSTKPNLDISFDEDNPELNIKVNWKGKHEAFHLRKYQKFSDIFNKLAERENINTENIVFNLNERLISPDDTPDSIGYKFFHFIDGRVLVNRFNSPGVASAAGKKRDANKITLKIQSDKWKRPLLIDLMKTDKFRILYIKCAEELKVNIEQLKLSFDGEFLEINDTPADLDLEGGEAIDLRIKD